MSEGSLTVSGDTVLQGGLEVSKSTTLQSLRVNAALSLDKSVSLTVNTLTASAVVTDSLTVDRVADLHCPLALTGDLSAHSLTLTDSLTVAGPTLLNTVNTTGVFTAEQGMLSVGDVVVAGGLTVRGNAAVEGDLSVRGSSALRVLDLGAGLSLDALTVANLTVTHLRAAEAVLETAVVRAALRVDAGLSVTGDVFISGGATVTQLAVLTDATVSGALATDRLQTGSLEADELRVTSSSTLMGTVDSTMAVISATDLRLNGTVSVAGDALFSRLEAAGGLVVRGGISSYGDISALEGASLRVSGAVVGSGDLQVLGRATLASLDVTAGDTVLSALRATSMAAASHTATGQLAVGSLLVDDSLVIGADLTVGGAVRVAGSIAAQSIEAERTVQTSYTVHNITATHLTTASLTVTGDAVVGGRLDAQASSATDLFVGQALTVDGAVQLRDALNVTGRMVAQGGILSAGDIETSGLSGITTAGPIVSGGNLSVLGKASFSSAATRHRRSR